jgi:hypothetical protein
VFAIVVAVVVAVAAFDVAFALREFLLLLLLLRLRLRLRLRLLLVVVGGELYAILAVAAEGETPARPSHRDDKGAGEVEVISAAGPRLGSELEFACAWR